MSRRLLYYGYPTLRQKAKEVTEINDEIRSIAEDLAVIANGEGAAGCAANQVGELYRLFALRLYTIPEEGDWVLGECQIFINPKLSNISEEMEIFEEGCLSIPGLRVPVLRPAGCTVEAQDINGEWFKLDLQGFPSRQIFHENDHLNGVLQIDRIPSKKLRSEIDPILSRIKKQYN